MYTSLLAELINLRKTVDEYERVAENILNKAEIGDSYLRHLLAFNDYLELKEIFEKSKGVKEAD